MYFRYLISLSLGLLLEANDKTVTNDNKTTFQKEKEFFQAIEDSNDYILASTMYNIKDYKKSYELFFKLFSKNSYNVNVNYFLALSAIEIEKYDEASSAFERILTQKPDFNQARYEYAKLLFKLNLKEEAKKEFTILSNSQINDETKKSVSNYLDILNKETKYFSTNANILLGVGRSTNVNTGLISPEYRLPGLNDVLVNGQKPIADNYHNEMLGINFLNSFKNSPYVIKNAILVYNKNYFNEENENLTAYSYKPTIFYLDQTNKNLYALNFGFTKIEKRDNENFNVFNITPTFSNALITSSLNYQRISYIHQVDEEKDFNKYEFLLKYNLLTNLNIYSKLGKSVRVTTERIDLDKNSITGGLEYIYEINGNNLIKFNYEYVKDYFRYENSYFNSKREDDNHFTELAYITKIDKENQIILSSSYSKNLSNQDAYTYKEVDGKINYIKSFNW